MASFDASELTNEFLGSMQVLAAALGDVMEDALVQEVFADQITASQLRVLKLIARTETQSVSDLAGMLGVSSAAASKATDRLVRRELVRRTEGAADRRAIFLSLTERGQQLMRQYEAARDKQLERIFRQFDLEQLRNMASTMERLAVAIVKQTGNPEDVCLQCKMYFREKCLMREFSKHNCAYDRQAGRAVERQKSSTRPAGDLNEQLWKRGASGQGPDRPINIEKVHE